jgi:plasmid stabilization system protein ParE
VSQALAVEPEAQKELVEAARWYERQRPGLGRRFLAAVEDSLDHILAFPATGAPVPHVPPGLPARRVPVDRFPYQIVYLETPGGVRVLAVAHDRRRPGYWWGRGRR